MAEYATLYTLEARTILTGGRDEVEFYCRNPIAPMERMWINGTNDYAVPIVSTKNLPIYCVEHGISRCRKPSEPMFEPGFEVIRDKTYFAIEPALREILEEPFRSRMDELGDKVARMKSAIESLEFANRNLKERSNDLELKMIKFNRLPWWLRVWKAIVKGV